jgi:hypothetical protein
VGSTSGLVGRKVLLVATAACLSCLIQVACGSSGLLGRYKKIEPLPDGKSVVYIYRDPLSARYAYTIKADGKSLVSLKPGAYYPLIVEPGELELSASAEGSTSLTLDVKKGKSYYVEFFLSRGVLVAHPNLVERPAQLAEIIILECRQASEVTN